MANIKHKDNSIGKEKFFSLLTKISMKYFQFPFAYIDFDMIIDDIINISDANYGLLNVFDTKRNQLITKAIADPLRKNKAAESLVGFPLRESIWQLTSEDILQLKSQKLIHSKELFEVVLKKLSREKSRQIQDFLGLSDIYSIGICNNEDILGSVILGWKKGHEVKRIERIELFINLLGTVLLRKRAEIELQLREKELKTLNEEIKAINKELEASLEQLTATEAELHSKYDELHNKENKLIESEERWMFAFQSSGSSVWDWNVQTKDVIYSETALKLFGYGYAARSRKEDTTDRVHPEDLDYVRKELEKHFGGETEIYETVHRVKCVDGSYRWVLDKGKVVSRTEDGKPKRMVGIYIDYTERRKAEELLKTQKEMMDSLIRYAPDGIVVLDKDMRIIDINEKFYEMFGYKLDDCKNMNIDDLIASGSDLELYCEAKNITEMARKFVKIEFESLRTRKDGLLIPVGIRGGPTIVDGEVIGYHAIYTDIRERKKAEEEIKYLSYHDKLTGLYNRAYFEEKLKFYEGLKYLPIAILVGDVNSLKLTNDIFGHLEGDKLLIEIAQILKSVFKDKGVVARWGGDEFVVILPNTDQYRMMEYSAEIQDACCRSKYEPIKISISLGWAVRNKSDTSFYDLINEAEEKMYYHKLLEDKRTRSNLIASLQKSLSQRSHETEEHFRRMKVLSINLGKKLGLDERELDQLNLLAIVHDIGKIAIPESILTKKGKLTEDQWEEVKKHPEIGYRISKSSSELFHVAEDILSHHERWDGKGYPRGLKGGEVPKLSRILAIVDAYDAMTSTRAYRKPISHEEALKEIINCSNKQFDPQIALAFVRMMEESYQELQL